MRATLSLLVLVALGCASTALAQSCPQACVDGSCSTLAQANHSNTQGFSCNGGFGGFNSESSSYDLALGQLTVSTSVTQCSIATAQVIGRDRYELLGPVTGVPLVFGATLHITGTASNASASAGIGEGDSFPPGTSIAIPSPVDRTLSVVLNHVVGDSFDLTYTLSTTGFARFGASNLTGVLSFTNLPPGYGIASCQGFSTGVVVPTRPASWGTLKIHYR
jgi:hypothetical protein